MENMVLSDIKNNVVEEEYMKFNNPNEVKEFKVVLENLQMERQRNDAIDSVSKNEEVEKMREKVKGKDIITLPETISEEKPLEVFGCNK